MLQKTLHNNYVCSDISSLLRNQPRPQVELWEWNRQLVTWDISVDVFRRKFYKILWLSPLVVFKNERVVSKTTSVSRW